jgi:CIC family chloride channel protein
MIFEMTKDYSFILPLMLAVVSSTMVVQIILKRSVHERHLEKQGYRVALRNEINVLKQVTVRQVMNNDVVLIPEKRLSDSNKKLMESKHSTFYTINKQNILSGTIIETELRQIITEYEHIREVLVARDIASQGVTTVFEDDDLDSVMKLFEKKGADEFPVLNSAKENKIVGTIRRQEVISAYNRESLKQICRNFYRTNLKKYRIKNPRGFLIIFLLQKSKRRISL